MQTSITSEELADMGDVTILDVRKKPAYDEDTVVIAGPAWSCNASKPSARRVFSSLSMSTVIFSPLM